MTNTYEWETVQRRPRKRSTSAILASDLDLSDTSSMDNTITQTSTPNKRPRTQTQATQERYAPKWPTYKIVLNKDITAETLALVHLQKQHPNLKVKVTRTSSGQHLIRPQDTTASITLQNMTAPDNTPFQLQRLQNTRQAVIYKVPIQNVSQLTTR